MSLLGNRSSALGDLDNSEAKAIKFVKEEDMPNEDKHIEYNNLRVRVNVNKTMTKRFGWNPQVVSYVLGNKRIVLPTVGLPVDYSGYIIKFKWTHYLTIRMAERRFVLKYSPVPKVTSILTPPPMPKMSSFGKVPTLGKGKLGSFGKAPEPVEKQAEKAPVAEAVAGNVVSYQYVIYVAENDVKWDWNRTYALILQYPLGANSPREFMAMVGLSSISPGKSRWVQSLCSAVVRFVPDGEHSAKVTAGLDVVDVSEAITEWVVT